MRDETHVENHFREVPKMEKRESCDVCDIKEIGHGSIGLYGIGWQVCIRRQGVTYDMVINHRGDQIAVPVAFCPECGAELKVEGEK